MRDRETLRSTPWTTGLTLAQDIAFWGYSLWIRGQSVIALMSELRGDEWPPDRMWDHNGRIEGELNGGLIPLHWSLPWLAEIAAGKGSE